MCTGQQYNPQTHFPNRVVPTDHVTQRGHVSYPLIPMHHNQSTPTQGSYYDGNSYHATGIASLGGAVYIPYSYLEILAVIKFGSLPPNNVLVDLIWWWFKSIPANCQIHLPAIW